MKREIYITHLLGHIEIRSLAGRFAFTFARFQASLDDLNSGCFQRVPIGFLPALLRSGLFFVGIGIYLRRKKFDLTALPDAEEIALTHETRHAEKKAARKAELKAADVAASFTKAATPSTNAPTLPANVKEQIATRVRRLEERHQREVSEIVDRFRVRLAQERDELTRAVRLNELAGQIEKLRAKCEKPSIWRRLFGLARRDRRELEALDVRYTTAKARIDDRVRVMQDGHTRTLEILRTVQQRELQTTLKVAFQKTEDRAPNRSPEINRLRKARDSQNSLER